jgi:uncharacterized protein (DUF2164 family)
LSIILAFSAVEFVPAGNLCQRNARCRRMWFSINIVQCNMHASMQQERGNMAIKLQQEVEARLLKSIQRYCSENMDEEAGELKARLLLDFCLREIGPTIYNQAILDAQAAMQDRIAEIETVCYETEFGYWKK